jgi:hypothetical protein
MEMQHERNPLRPPRARRRPGEQTEGDIPPVDETMDATQERSDHPGANTEAKGEKPAPPNRAWLLFIFMFAVYSLNPDYIWLNDLTPNTALPLNILSGDGVTFSPGTHPFMFGWQYAAGDKNSFVKVNSWPPELRRQYETGALKLVGCKYYLTESAIHGRYVNIYGLGTALTALPVYAVMELILPDFAARPQLVRFTAREIAAALTALSAMCLYLAALRFTVRRNALIVALAFGLGTCVWSTCSQGLWQQTPTVFYLALGTCLFVRIDERRRWLAIPCAMAMAAAVWCRPTSAVVVLCVGAWLALRDRRAFAAYALAGLPFGAALVFYNYHWLGSPFAFGQGPASQNVAVAMTGSTSLWQTSLSDGLAGLLASPARGLFVFSPIFLLAIPGMVRIWTSPKLAVLRPLAVAALIILCMEAKFFCWWGGWSYGYRLVLDITVFLSLLLIPAVDLLRRNVLLCGLFAVMFLWSAAVQIIGVTLYDLDGWNCRKATVVARSDRPNPIILLDKNEAEAMRKDPAFVKSAEVGLNVDDPAFHSRLWSITDSPIVYYLTHAGEAREHRATQSQRYAADALSRLFGNATAQPQGTESKP